MAEITNVVKDPDQNNKNNWEIAAAVLIKIGKITLRVMSYVMNVVLTIMLIGLVPACVYNGGRCHELNGGCHRTEVGGRT